MKVTFLNTSIATTCGTFVKAPISEEDARILIANASELESAIGHIATAMVFSEILGTLISANRIQYSQQVGDIALILQMNDRVPEATVLSVAEMKALKFSLFTMIRTE